MSYLRNEINRIWAITKERNMHHAINKTRKKKILKHEWSQILKIKRLRSRLVVIKLRETCVDKKKFKKTHNVNSMKRATDG